MASRARAFFWLRWVTRDARARWVQVLAIAVLIALGTGMYSALSSMSRWRVVAADASYEKLRMHDLRVSMAEASYAPEGALAAAVRDTRAVRAAEERLVVGTQVDASQPGRTVLVPGRIVGARVPSRLDLVDTEHGRGLTPGDAGTPNVVLERNFADHYKLPAAGDLRLTGAARAHYVGQAKAPEYFIVTAPGAQFGAEASFAVVFASLETAQRLTRRPGRVNELLVAGSAGTSPAGLERAVSRALLASHPDAAFTFTRRADEAAHHLIYTDAKNDQQMFDIFAFLLLGAAAFAAFNLVSRAVESQRREIGIGMALGVSRARLAARPLLLGAEIASLGVLLGVPIGLAANAWFGGLIEEWFPLPVVDASFEPDMFLEGALLGFALPLLATTVPVWRAVRAAPVEAIRIGARAGRSSGLAWLARDLRVPGGTLANMPVRTVLRTPRRTALTAIGIAAVVAIVVALSGVMDSFGGTLALARDEALAGDARRMTVDLVVPQPPPAAPVKAVESSPAVGAAQRSLRLTVSIGSSRARIDGSLEFVAPSGKLWRPTLREGSLAGAQPGVALARVAARDLGVGVGDVVRLEHPVPSGESFALRTSSVRVLALHASPFRFLAYANGAAAERLGLAGLVNHISVVPAAGVTSDDVKRALLTVQGVAAVQSASAVTDAVDARMDQFAEVVAFTLIIAMTMAMLMAYNATAISADERARETATMFAFGVRPERVLRLEVAEGFITALLATAIGLTAGYALLKQLVTHSFTETMPDVGMVTSIEPMTFVLALLAGVVAVTAAPLLTRRRLRRIDIPNTLRVVE